MNIEKRKTTLLEKFFFFFSLSPSIYTVSYILLYTLLLLSICEYI